MASRVLILLALLGALVACQPAAEPAPKSPVVTPQPQTQAQPSATQPTGAADASGAAQADSSNSGLQQLNHGDSGGY